MSARRSAVGRPWRSIVEAAILATIVLAVLRTAFAEWVVVVDSSMMPTLAGQHVAGLCPRCGASIRFAIRPLELPRARSRCRACLNEVTPAELGVDPVSGHGLVDGDRLLVVRGAPSGHASARWMPVLCRTEASPARLLKRLVGLPGEQVALDQGDLFINGHVQRKSWDLARRLAVPLLDSDDERRRDRSSWIPESPASRWFDRSAVAPSVAEPDGLEGRIAAADWLVLRHERRTAAGDWVERPLSDWIPENDVHDGLPVEAPRDLLFEVELTVTAGALVLVRLDNGREAFLVAIDLHSGQLTAWRRPDDLVDSPDEPAPRPDWRNEACTPPGSIAPSTAPRRPVRLQVALVDRRLWVRLDGRPGLELDYAAPPDGLVTSRPVAIAVGAGSIELGPWSLARDLHYGRPSAGGHYRGLDFPVRLGPDDYFVLGDNPAVSVDSRYPGFGCVRGADILGRPLFVHWPDSSWRLGPWQVRVPELSRIRYIP